jgi:dihydropteroate synthase
MNSRAIYGNVVAEVRDELRRRVDAVVAEGVDPSMIILDPGLGFSKLTEHNWQVLAALPEIAALGPATGPARAFPVLVGASRKRFLGHLLAAPDGTPRPFTGSDDATVATTALAAAAGAWCVRVHKVPANADAVRVAAAWQAARPGPGSGSGGDGPD